MLTGFLLTLPFQSPPATLNAIADGLANLMKHQADRHDDTDLNTDMRELRLAVGISLEERESTKQ